MKQKDLALILVIAVVAGVFSFVFSKLLISKPSNRNTKVEVVEVITAEFKEPNKKYFNENSVNPTKLIQIGQNPNPQPFQ
jgi:capsular polysaccharide biosynthesis protein